MVFRNTSGNYLICIEDLIQFELTISNTCGVLANQQCFFIKQFNMHIFMVYPVKWKSFHFNITVDAHVCIFYSIYL